MTYHHPVPTSHRGWQVKIQAKERVEPPHATIWYRTRHWRYGLREHAFLDREPPGRDVPPEIVALIEDGWAALVTQWDALHPENPVQSVPDLP